VSGGNGRPLRSGPQGAGEALLFPASGFPASGTPGQEIPVIWRRSARARRMTLRIDPARRAVVLTLPEGSSEQAGLDFLRRERDWVQRRLAALPEAVPFQPGARIPLSGRIYEITHCPERRGGVWLEEDRLCVSGEIAFLPRRVRAFLEERARRELGALARAKAAPLGLMLRAVSVRDPKSRWGSCSADGKLNFSWRLIMAPPFVQDYVAAHEVAHLRHMNHGRRFWALVETLTPHRAAARAWLARHGNALLRIGLSG
jgi:predicted metal-dependent hydrolase